MSRACLAGISVRGSYIVQNFTAVGSPWGTFAPIWLSVTTSNCTVVGGPNATNVVDRGTNNTLVGVNNMHDNPPGPAVRDAMKREMEMPKSVSNSGEIRSWVSQDDG
jgi:hypothetical protein